MALRKSITANTWRSSNEVADGFDGPLGLGFVELEDYLSELLRNHIDDADREELVALLSVPGDTKADGV